MQLLKANKDRSKYEEEFALNHLDISYDDTPIDLEVFDTEFPWVWRLILDYIHQNDFTWEWNIVLWIQHLEKSQKAWFQDLIWQAESSDNYKFWWPQNSELRHENKTTIIGILYINKTWEKDDFGRPMYTFKPKLIQIPPKSTNNNLNLTYTKDIDQTELTEFIKQNKIN